MLVPSATPVGAPDPISPVASGVVAQPAPDLVYRPQPSESLIRGVLASDVAGGPVTQTSYTLTRRESNPIRHHLPWLWIASLAQHSVLSILAEIVETYSSTRGAGDTPVAVVVAVAFHIDHCRIGIRPVHRDMGRGEPPNVAPSRPQRLRCPLGTALGCGNLNRVGPVVRRWVGLVWGLRCEPRRYIHVQKLVDIRAVHEFLQDHPTRVACAHARVAASVVLRIHSVPPRVRPALRAHSGVIVVLFPVPKRHELRAGASRLAR